MCSTDLAGQIVCTLLDVGDFSRKGSSNIPAGLTYLGQLISHDIVPATSTNFNSRNVSPYLNLDSIYGDFPGYVYEFFPEHTGLMNSKGEFHLTPLGKFGNVERFDFARALRVTEAGEKKYIAKIPEVRNDENTIVSQFQIFWMLFHKQALNRFSNGNPEKARKLTVMVFQLVVIEIFLRELLPTNVFTHYFRSNKRCYTSWLNPDNFEIPAFFSKAAFRFGHSMVRPSYTLNERDPDGKDLTKLMRAEQKLLPEFTVDWPMFFYDTPKFKQKSLWIDSQISFPMSEVRFPRDDSVDVLHVIKRNMAATMQSSVMTGVDAYQAVSESSCELAATLPVPKSVVEQSRFSSYVPAEDLPLWPYLLIEAEYTQDGERLGQLGAILVAEVLRESISRSPVSVYVNDEYDFNLSLSKLGPLGEILVDKENNQTTLSIKKIINFVS